MRNLFLFEVVMESRSEKIRSLAEAAGADMVGFAPVERFAAGPERTRPTFDYNPQPIERVRDRTGCRYLPRK